MGNRRWRSLDVLRCCRLRILLLSRRGGAWRGWLLILSDVGYMSLVGGLVDVIVDGFAGFVVAVAVLDFCVRRRKCLV